jgi:hypothetical protein
LVCCGFDDPIADAQEGSFIVGAEWADSNPNPEIIKRVLLYALQHTNILLADDWDEVRWNLLIKKAMEE